ncbi:MAG: RNA methyltransferase [Verrucomicrobia bacterium]|nr:RNA methyltransferase [Verrucomicrobiota bacterium]MDA1087964.1 RNA methyltransferase [Verrucomicrobiota bacterium]
MALEISSARNPRLTAAAQLRTRRERDRSGQILVEGLREIERACDAGLRPNELFLTADAERSDACVKILRICADSHADVLICTPPAFAKLAIRGSAYGVVGIFPTPNLEISRLNVTSPSLVVVSEHLEKPGNLGAILRTCDGAGVDAVIVSDPATDIYNPNVIRASLGTVFTQQVVTMDRADAIGWLRRNDFRIVAASPAGREKYTDTDYRANTAIVLGSEARGLSENWHTDADALVQIPMRGCVDSLNVSATAAILLYEAVRQRGL